MGNTKMVNQKTYLNKIHECIKRFLTGGISKETVELNWWKTELPKIPRPKERIFKRYCDYFEINENSFSNKIVVDIGCGPVGSLHFFNAKVKIGVDPLANEYGIFDNKTHEMIYLSSNAENIPLISNYADVVISVNALDHISDFDKGVEEASRILKPDGVIFLEINLDGKASICEPIVLNLHDSINELEKYFIIDTKKIIKKGSIFEFDGVATEYDYDLLIVKGRKKERK